MSRFAPNALVVPTVPIEEGGYAAQTRELLKEHFFREPRHRTLDRVLLLAGCVLFLGFLFLPGPSLPVRALPLAMGLAFILGGASEALVPRNRTTLAAILRAGSYAATLVLVVAIVVTYWASD
jgi:uncharacterized membrane protein HdeD (DUF308 family)